MDPRFINTIPSLRYDDDKCDDEYAFVKALCMSGGDGANSYSANSRLQVLQYLRLLLGFKQKQIINVQIFLW
ncbi:putative salicylate carboxymethyltransferase [Arabidopsis thaliana]|uniref:Uncharacterized protein n=1 Tax=Arabidopsis thaliana TaxID=3702 RepID=A0A178VCT1_ARATH|nr:hypothetical protein AXX17_AT3G11390 [Arabidopsis thaliana]